MESINVISAEHLKDYQVKIRYSDKKENVVDFSVFLNAHPHPAYTHLNDINNFKQFWIEDGNIVIAAHNYKAHFGNITTLQEEDQVIFTDVSGNENRYYVAGIETVEPIDVEGVINSLYDMTLFTCTYGGKARVVVGLLKL